jgi:hypothetical protein
MVKTYTWTIFFQKNGLHTKQGLTLYYKRKVCLETINDNENGGSFEELLSLPFVNRTLYKEQVKECHIPVHIPVMDFIDISFLFLGMSSFENQQNILEHYFLETKWSSWHRGELSVHLSWNRSCLSLSAHFRTLSVLLWNYCREFHEPIILIIRLFLWILIVQLLSTQEQLPGEEQ